MNTLNLHSHLKYVLLYLSLLILTITVVSFYYSKDAIVSTDQRNNVNLPRVVPATACTSDAKYCDSRKTLLIHSRINYSTSLLLKSWLLIDSGIEQVCFTSIGGRTLASKLMMNDIARRNMDTCIAESYRLESGELLYFDTCQSACALLMLAGQKRTAIGEQFEIGVHPSSAAFGRLTIPNGIGLSSLVEQRNPRAVGLIKKVDATEMLFLTAAQMQKYKFINEVLPIGATLKKNRSGLWDMKSKQRLSTNTFNW
ncbi:hypothetical protein AAFX24_27540 [Vibrio mediterranei]|uniref:hypothetical protein n=1 Tax=Vibrio mediterranei TaxID=689 RepID=UPI0038CE3956